MKKNFNLFVLCGLILGILGGVLFPDIMKKIAFLGTIYVNLLKFMILPIIFTSIMVTIYNSVQNKTKILGKTILIFTIMFTVTFLITSAIVTVTKPGINFEFENVEWSSSTTNFELSEIITNLFPSNIITMIESNNVFASIIFAAVCGYCTSKIKNGQAVIDIVNGFKDIFNELLRIIMYFTPVGVLALIGNTVANYGSVIFGMGAKYIGMSYFCSIVALFLVMILPVWIFSKISPLDYIKKVSKVWVMTLTTCSSSATLPYTIEVCNKELGIPEKITNIVVPLGCTIHMCGGAVSFALLGIFCMQLYGIEMSAITYVLMLISAILINMAAPGIPNGGIVIGASYLSMFGIPLSFMGFYAGIYKLLDMAYTTLNVTGDITANIIIDQTDKNN